jgi:hypothetical protein
LKNDPLHPAVPSAHGQHPNLPHRWRLRRSDSTGGLGLAAGHACLIRGGIAKRTNNFGPLWMAGIASLSPDLPSQDRRYRRGLGKQVGARITTRR